MNRRGLTIIELMVAIILTGIVAFIVIEMIRGESENYSKTRRKVKLQTDAREAIRIIEEELKNAGFRMTASTTSNGVLTTSSCGNSYDNSGKITYFSPLQHGIEFRLYNPFESSGSDFDCDANLITIQYVWDPATKILSRKFALGKNPDMSKFEFVPFLEGVENFSFLYGIYRKNDFILQPSDLSTSSTSANNAAAVIESDSMLTISNWTTDPSTVVFAKDLGVLDTLSTYRISFTSYGNEIFMDSTTGFHDLKAGFYTSASGGATSDTFTFRPGISAGAGDVRTIQYDFVPNSDIKDQHVYFGFSGKMKTGVTGASLIIGSIRIKHLNSGKIDTWVEYDNIDAPWDRVGAIQVLADVKNKKNETLHFQRSISVVNNDGTN